MADITMCQDGECASASECHRFCAVPSPQQWYAQFWHEREPGAFKCPHFIQRRTGDRTKYQQVQINAAGQRVKST